MKNINVSAVLLAYLGAVGCNRKNLGQDGVPKQKIEESKPDLDEDNSSKIKNNSGGIEDKGKNDRMPLTSKPEIDEPKIDEPKIDEPKTDETKIDEPKIDGNKIDGPKINVPKIDGPKIDETKIDEPKIDEPKIDEPKFEKPKIDEPKTDKTKIDEPEIDETKIDEPRTEKPEIEKPKNNKPKLDSESLKKVLSQFKGSLNERLIFLAKHIFCESGDVNMLLTTYGTLPVIRLLYETTIDKKVKEDILQIYGEYITKQLWGFSKELKKEIDGKLEIIWSESSETLALIKDLMPSLIEELKKDTANGGKYLHVEEFLENLSVSEINQIIKDRLKIGNDVIKQIDDDTVAIFVNILKAKARWTRKLFSNDSIILKFEETLFNNNNNGKELIPFIDEIFETKIFIKGESKFTIVPACGGYGVVIGVNDCDQSNTEYYKTPEITHKVLSELLKAKNEKVKVVFPMMKFSCTTDLKEMFADIMPNTLSKDKDKFFKSLLSTKKVKVNNFFQLSDLWMNSEGFDAQSGTVVELVEEESKRINSSIVEVKADHAFSFAIIKMMQDKGNVNLDKILFQGRIVEFTKDMKPSEVRK